MVAWWGAFKALPASFQEYWAIPENLQTGDGGEVGDIYTFLKKTLELLDVWLYSWKTYELLLLQILKNCVTPFGENFKRSKTKTHGNSTWFFCEHPWKFHFLSGTSRCSCKSWVVNLSKWSVLSFPYLGKQGLVTADKKF